MVASLVAEGVPVLAAVPREATLEEVYFALVASEPLAGAGRPTR